MKAIQSGLVNILSKGMAQFYTDVTAQHAVTRVENLQTLTPPPSPRFTSGGIAHPASEAFPPYLQPEVSFIEGACPPIMENTEPTMVAAGAPPSKFAAKVETRLSIGGAFRNI